MRKTFFHGVLHDITTIAATRFYLALKNFSMWTEFSVAISEALISHLFSLGPVLLWAFILNDPVRWRMLHQPTMLHVIDLKNNHSLMRLANYGCSLKWLCFGTGLILLFFGIFGGNQCPHRIRHQIFHETVSVLISNFPNFDYGRSLYEPLNWLSSLNSAAFCVNEVEFTLPKINFVCVNECWNKRKMWMVLQYAGSSEVL